MQMGTLACFNVRKGVHVRAEGAVSLCFHVRVDGLRVRKGVHVHAEGPVSRG